MIIALTTIVVIGLMVGFSGITAHAGAYDDYAKAWLEKKRAEQEKYMDELEADGNLTQEAIDSISKGTSTRTPNHKSSSKRTTSGSTSSGNSKSSGSVGSGKGWVYSADELHVIGLPTGENGYTKPGYYGDVE